MTTPYREMLEAVLPRVSTPAQYLGGELGAVVKDADEVRQRWALLFPDTYAIGMSHLGLKILYGVLNAIPGVAAERAFAPWFDMEAEMRRIGLPLLTLETRTPVRNCDVVGFSLTFELGYTNVLAMLDLAGIPLLARDRDESCPLVIGGGANAFHPEPIADFFDLFLLGDGEDAVVRISRRLEECRAGGLSRSETILALARGVPGLYAPAFYEPRYREDGRLAEVVPVAEGLPERVAPTHVADLGRAPFPARIPVPYVSVTHDRLSIEVMRGCTHGCRFCQAGMLDRPVRLRTVEQVLEIAREGYRATGYDEISLLSLSTADYPFLVPLAAALDREFRDRRVNISIPSLRVNKTLRLIPESIGGVRKSGFTVAPEVATDRLRGVIDKKIRNEDLYAGVASAYRQGWRAVKLYFMLGLPTERDEDVDAIVSMARRCSEIGREAGGGPADVTLSVGNFIPKPHTPFQWEAMDTEESLLRKRERLFAAARKNRKLRLKVHRTGRSLAEALLARGDRHLSRVLLRLFRAGSRFDAWDEGFDRERWDRALREEGVDPALVVHRERAADEFLPWDHLGAPVDRAWLAAQRERAGRGETSENCMTGKCNHCGVDVAGCAPALRAFREASGGKPRAE